MITGIVNAHLEATIRLAIRGRNGQVRRVKAVVDTGFDGWLTLPPALIAQLGLSWHQRSAAIFADGSRIVFDVYSGIVVWERLHRAIPIDEADTTPLIGTAFLEEHELKADFRPGGKVTIKGIGPRL